MHRLCVYPHDAQKILGRSLNYCRKMIRDIKAHYNKKKHQYVSVEEFCEYTGLDPDKVYQELNNSKSIY